MATTPLMPKATAVWLVENTALSFEQIADFCKLHVLEVKAIADGDAAQGIKGLDPVLTGQLTREQISNAEADHSLVLHMSDPKVRLPEQKKKKGRATPGVAPPGPAERDPVAGAQSSRAEGRGDHAPGRHHQVDHPGHPRAHALERRAAQPLDPVTLGLCSQIDLDFEVQRAAKEKPVPADAGATLLPAAVTPRRRKPRAEAEQTSKKPADELNVDAVFAKLKQLGGKQEDKGSR
jgi:hypothetical protein